MEIYITTLLILSISIASYYVAKRKNRNPYLWAIIGLLFGLIAFFILLLLPKVTVEKATLTTKQPLENSFYKEAPLEISYVKNHTWYYLDNFNKTVGPINYKELLSLWENQNLTPQTLVWQQEMQNWQSIESLNDLYSSLEKESYLK